jgi:TPR repeat protein
MGSPKKRNPSRNDSPMTHFEAKKTSGFWHALVSLGAVVLLGCAGDPPPQPIAPPADEETIELLRQSANLGDIEAQAALGRHYLGGDGTDTQPLRGLYWLRRAAQAGEPDAQALLGASFLHGIGRALLRADQTKAEKWLLAASEQGVAQAQYDLATLYFGLDANEQGLLWLQKAIAQNHAKAHTLLSSLYHTGRRVPLDDEESIRLLRRAAELGDPDAQNQFGMALREGSRLEKDPHESFEWFQKAAWSGFTDAQFNLGLAYFRGTGVEQDRVRGVAWLEVCRDKTHRGAIRELGRARSELSAMQRSAAEELHREIATQLAPPAQ